MKASKKANDLIGEFSTATERTALSPSDSMFALYCSTREDLEDYIADLERLVDHLIKAGNAINYEYYQLYGCDTDKSNEWDALVQDWKSKGAL